MVKITDKQIMDLMDEDNVFRNKVSWLYLEHKNDEKDLSRSLIVVSTDMIKGRAEGIGLSLSESEVEAIGKEICTRTIETLDEILREKAAQGVRVYTFGFRPRDGQKVADGEY